MTAFRKTCAVLGCAVLGWLALSGLAAAQLHFSTVTLFGKSAPSVLLGGAEYARDSVLTGRLKIERDGDLIRVRGFGHALLLPLDADARRAASGGATVQLDTARVNARTATLIHDHLYLPLDTLARGLGADYAPGRLSLPPARLTGVASRAGEGSDRLVLELKGDASFSTRLVGNRLELVLPGVSGAEQTYSTSGHYLPRVRVRRENGDLVVSAPLPGGSGFRAYAAPPITPGQAGTGQAGTVQTGVVLDVGPGVPLQLPALQAKLRRPLIVLDPLLGAPNSPGSLPGDVTLEVARAVGDLLTQAGWQVRLTRGGAEPASPLERAAAARSSDVFLSVEVASLPGAAAGGVTLYEGRGDSGLTLTDAVRADGAPGTLSRLAVGGDGEQRRLSQLVRGELSALNLKVRVQQQSQLLALREAPHAALLIELGWAQNGADAARLRDRAALSKLATALARGVASYLSARAEQEGGT